MKPNILLINPSINPKTQNKILTNIIRISFPMSLGHLAGYIETYSSYSVKIIDEQILSLDDENVEKHLSLMPSKKIVGFSTLTVTSSRVYELTKKFKEIDPDVTTVIGGVHATVLPEEGLQQSSVDFIVRGEGELTFSELIDAILMEKDHSQIDGISYRKNGDFIHNKTRKLLKDLNTLPPFPYHLFEREKEMYSGFYSIQTSRGCPYACIFCSQRSLTGRSYRYVSTARVLQDINLLIDKYNASTIRILDDNIGANKKRLMHLLNALIENGINNQVSFEAPMRGDNLDEEMLDKLKEANFSVLTFGLETESERLMKLINKEETVDDVVKAINMTAKKGITTGTTLIFGLPTETRKERWKTIKLVNSLPLDSARFNILTPYPGTPVYNQLLQEEKKLTIRDGWINFSVQYMWAGDDIPYVPDGTDKYELIFTTMLANLWFYLKPSGWMKMFTKSVAGGNVVLLPPKWYLTDHLFEMIKVGTYLSIRFFVVFFKLIFHAAKNFVVKN